MRISCIDCGVANDANNKYCGSCGSALSLKCHACGFDNHCDANFCGGCGLDIQKKPDVTDGERRQLTVMFCDLVGSSELAEQFDPEELRDLLRSFQQCVAEVTLRYGGHIAKYIGDGLLVYFGHPHAHEDDAKRSILSGLGIVEEVEKLNKGLLKQQDIELKVRIGIHTGLVVVGQMGSGDTLEENAIVGETPNIAARIESLAMPNTVAISQDTHDLVKGLFFTENLGQQKLKGVSHPTHIFKVTAESNFLTEFDVRRRDGMTPMVGRSRELDFLSECWEQAKNGLGQIVWLSGEAGVGKSRIISEFMAKISNEPQHLRLYHCSSVHTNTAFYPIVTYLKYLLNWNKNDSDKVKYSLLETLFENFTFPMGNFVPVIAPLLGIKVKSDIPKDTSPEKTKEAIIEAWMGLMTTMAEEQPLLLIFEDTHWIDPSTQELMNMISSQLASKQILLLFTSRPGYHFSVEKDVILQSLTLNRLDNDNSYSMVSQLAGRRSLPDELIHELVARTDGIPLFIEEITKTVIGSGLLRQLDKHYELSEPLSTLAIPKTLKDSLMARLDQLSEVKKVAQLAATIGRKFSVELLQSISLENLNYIDLSLAQLLESSLIEVCDKSDASQYQFRHALLQETAYKSLLKSTRREYHGKIANALVDKFPAIAKEEPEVVAFHFTEARETEQAIVYWLKAGKRANLTSSHNEAISHFSKCVELLNTLPQSKETLEQEFQIQVRLIGPLIAAQSYVSPLVEKAFTRALELSKQIDSSPEIFPVLHGRYAFYQVCGLIDQAETLVDEFFELAKNQKENYDTLEMIGNRMRGSSLVMMGKSQQAEQYFKDAIVAYDYGKHKSLNALYGQDIKVIALTYLGLNQWHQGKISEIKSCTDDAFELAKKIPSANTIGISHIVSKVIPYTLLDEPEAALEACDKAIEAAIALETPLWKVAGIIFKGWALVRLGSALGKEKEGMALLEQGVAAYNEMKLGLFRPLIMIIYAQSCMQMGLIIKGLETLEQSLQISAVGGEHWLDAETHRTMGELLLLKPDPDRKQALVEFEKALVIARQQSSITQELRVAMSLLSYANTDNDIAEAESQLRQVYEKFDDGQDFKDLVKARKLLGII